MNINSFDSEIKSGLKCPYCLEKSEYIAGSYICIPCDAYVGTHKGSTTSLGFLANKSLRAWRSCTHAHFDILWKHAVKKGRKKKEARTSAYKWLSNELNLPEEDTHIALFDIDLCRKAVRLCKKFIK